MLRRDSTLNFKDLEFRNIESIWVETANGRRRILLGLFYRPPNSDSAYLYGLEDSIALATDTNILDIIITGDFNLNFLTYKASRKISSICTQFSLFQSN